MLCKAKALHDALQRLLRGRSVLDKQMMTFASALARACMVVYSASCTQGVAASAVGP
jgi:hypothetical protein